MSTSVGMKSKKKQPASSNNPPSVEDRTDDEIIAFEQVLLQLEDACALILDDPTPSESEDIEHLFWEQRFQNMVTPVSLALAECKGPRRFHYHYRRREDDESVLHPVMESALDNLAHVCEQVLAACRGEFAVAHGSHLDARRRILENALQSFLMRYKTTQKA